MKIHIKHRITLIQIETSQGLNLISIAVEVGVILLINIKEVHKSIKVTLDKTTSSYEYTLIYIAPLLY